MLIRNADRGFYFCICFYQVRWWEKLARA